MTNADIERVSRSWIGHLATNPQVREKLSKARSDDDIASLINDTVIPKDKVEATDVPAIARHVQMMMVEVKEPHPLQNFQILNVVHPGSGGP
jgi:ribosomal protein L19E